jgi:hypothetical protein
MKTKILTITLAGAFLLATAIPAVTEARGGGGNAGGRGLQTQTRTINQDRARDRLRDGSCLQSAPQTKAGEAQKKGNTYGPGDGTGNSGDRPLDGTGYGAPANR